MMAQALSHCPYRRDIMAEPKDPFAPSAAGDGRLDAPAFHRNHEPIAAVLRRWLDDRPGNALEVGSGTGQHVVEFARAFPHLLWWPSDPDTRHIESIEGWRRQARLGNIERARRLDLTAPDWGLGTEDSVALSDLAAVVCINVLHISSPSASEGLMHGAARRLHPGGRLFVYGPFKQGGRHTAPSNAAFDASLRARNPDWGLRDIEDLRATGYRHGLLLAEIESMPANNMTLVFELGARPL